MIATTVNYVITQKTRMYLGYMQTDCKFGETMAITLDINIGS